MNKVMVTGLALGSEPEIDACQVCNYDMGWLFRNPSSLLWTDKIIVSPKILKLIHEGWAPEKNKKMGEAIHVIFEQIEKNELLEVKNPSEIITPEIRDDVFAEIESDCDKLLKMFPSTIKKGNDKVPGAIDIEGSEYCTPVLWSIYASLLVSTKWKANIFYQPQAYNFLKYKFGLNSNSRLDHTEKLTAFNEIFSTIIPEKPILPNVIYDPKCKKCKNEIECNTGAINKISKRTEEILAWRDYDEIHQLRETLVKISSDNDSGELTADQIIEKYKDTERVLRKKVYNLFPKIERWSNVVTILSLPVIVAGISTGSAAIASVGGAVGGLSTLSEKYVKFLKSKHKWLGFKSDVVVPNSYETSRKD